MAVVSAFLIIEHSAENAIFENLHHSLLKTWSRFYESSQAMPTYRSYFD